MYAEFNTLLKNMYVYFSYDLRIKINLLKKSEHPIKSIDQVKETKFSLAKTETKNSV